MKTYAILFFLCFACAPCLLADPLQRVDVMATTGFTTFPDNDWIEHWIAGGAARFYLTKRLAVEVETLYMRGPDSDRDFTFVPSVVYDLRGPENRTQPYLIGGAGVLWHRETFASGDFTGSSLSASGGIGVRHYLNDRLFMQGDARLGWETFFRTSFSIGYSFGK